MNEIFLAEATFRLIKERRSLVLDVLQYNNVKSMEHYRELMGELKALELIEQELKGLLEKQERQDD
jgi:hypothetical protein|tara:strand:- start:285 stop:482 length:198 start_codon:yes stop_codon:yes gene_type:complete